MKTTQEWLWDTSLNVLEWSSQSSDLNPIEHLSRDLTELEICREEWEKLPKYRCATVVSSYPRRLKMCFNKVLSKRSEYLKIFNKLAKNSKHLFLLCHYGVLCID
jgi:hypothetical protein